MPLGCLATAKLQLARPCVVPECDMSASMTCTTRTATDLRTPQPLHAAPHMQHLTYSTSQLADNISQHGRQPHMLRARMCHGHYLCNHCLQCWPTNHTANTLHAGFSIAGVCICCGAEWPGLPELRSPLLPLQDCTSDYPAICEVPKSVYACPPAPPPRPVVATVTPCEC
jgi:hypothetical protein